MSKIKGDICVYNLFDNLSREKYLKIQKFIDDNLDASEIVFGPIYED